jgi:hypothetical protein
MGLPQIKPQTYNALRDTREYKYHHLDLIVIAMAWLT